MIKRKSPVRTGSNKDSRNDDASSEPVLTGDSEDSRNDDAS